MQNMIEFRYFSKLKITNYNSFVLSHEFINSNVNFRKFLDRIKLIQSIQLKFEEN